MSDEQQDPRTGPAPQTEAAELAEEPSDDELVIDIDDAMEQVSEP